MADQLSQVVPGRRRDVHHAFDPAKREADPGRAEDRESRADVRRRSPGPGHCNRREPMTTTTTSPITPAATTTTTTTMSPPPQLIDIGKMPAETGVARLIDHAVTIGASDLFFAANDQHMAVLVRHLGLV